MSQRAVEEIVRKMESTSFRPTKKSIVNEFLEEAAEDTTRGKNSLRVQLARTENKSETLNVTMMKTKEKLNKLLEKLREQEEHYNISVDEVDRLRRLMNNN